jgi:hypothetical protein
VNTRTGAARWTATVAGVDATTAPIAEACEQCKIRAGVRRCVECAETYCVPCYKEHHSKGARRAHTFKLIAHADAGSSSTALVARS